MQVLQFVDQESDGGVQLRPFQQPLLSVISLLIRVYARRRNAILAGLVLTEPWRSVILYVVRSRVVIPALCAGMSREAVRRVQDGTSRRVDMFARPFFGLVYYIQGDIR